MVAAIVLAAGAGRRMETDVPKQFLTIGGEPVITKALRVFENCDLVDAVLLVTKEEYIDYCRSEIVGKSGLGKVTDVISGGKERWQSVQNALAFCGKRYGFREVSPWTEDGNYVLIHDGARPFVTEDILSRAVQEVSRCGAAAVGVHAKDTVKIADEDGFILKTPDRRSVWQIQTPQAFSYSLICAANRAVMETCGMDGVTDDAMIVEKSGFARVKLVEGAYSNRKLTTPEDLVGLEK